MLESIDQARSLMVEGGDAGGARWYGIQASIALEHATAPSFDATNWHLIADLYADLAEINPSPVVAVNRAVAVAHAGRPSDGLALLDDVADVPEMQQWHLYWSTRAELLTRLGAHRGCGRVPRTCPLPASMNDGDRRFLERRYEEGTATQRSRTQ